MGLFGDRKGKLQKKYERLLKESMEAQRAGDIQKSAQLFTSAEQVLEEMKQAG